MLGRISQYYDLMYYLVIVIISMETEVRTKNRRLSTFIKYHFTYIELTTLYNAKNRTTQEL